MKKDSRYIWYLLDMIAFLSINYILLRNIPTTLSEFLAGFSAFALIVLVLGTYRLTDVITQESVTEVIRAPFMDKKVENGKETWVPAENGFRGFYANLLSCNACMGVWVSMAVIYLYIWFPLHTLIFMSIMALTCTERFLSKFYNFLEKRG
jgi:hypothetical protein